MEESRAPDAGSSNGRKRRRKTFSGCWTCRAKHVKCDEAKPVCMRCDRAGVRCEGYGIRLSWTFLQDPSNFQPGKSPLRGNGRRTYTSDEQAPSHNSDQPITVDKKSSAQDSALQTSQAAPVSQSHTHWESTDPLPPIETTVGPASGTAATAASTPDHPTPVREPEQWNTSRQPSTASWRSHQPSPSTATAGLSVDALIDRVGQDSAITGPITRPGNSQADPYSDISWLPHYHPGASPESQSTRADINGTPVSGLRHLDTLPDPASQCKLLEHWTLNLCDTFAPIPGIHNPLRTIFTPIALEGAREDAGNSTGAVALFHLICSACGFHRSKLEADPESARIFENLALEHHNLGIAHLSQNIRSDDKNQHVSILASLIMCLYNETITVHNPSWRLHIRGAVEWVNHTGLEFWHQTESAAIIYQMFMGMAILIQSQILPGDRSGYGWDLHYDMKTQPQPYMLETIFGVSQPVLQVIHAMNCIQQKAQQTENAGSTPQQGGGLPSTIDLDRLELELLLMAPRKPPSSMTAESGQLMYHHGYTYYYAALIYIRRTMKGVPVEDVQGLVKQALVHFEALQTISTRSSLPLLWPIAITAFEAQESQHRMLRCLDFFVHQTGMAVWDKFGSSVRGLWAKRQSSGDVNLSWHAYSPVFYHNYMLI